MSDLDVPVGGGDSGAEDGLLLGPSRVSRAEALARHLEREIASQALPPGQRLGTKADLRNRYGVAVATVNEAVRLMEMRGLVAARPGPGGGLFVSGERDRARVNHAILGLDWEQATLRDCLDLRNALEPTVIRRAAQERTEADLADLRDILVTMREALDDPDRYLAVNWSLHRRIGEICTGPPLRTVYLVVIELLDTGLEDFEFDGPSESLLRTHEELVDAIADGGAQRLEAAINRHAATSPLPT
jgi:DNA-binding FadR family transcriptional regulator